MDGNAELSGARQMPHNLEAEAGVLGSLMLNPKRIDSVLGRLDPEDFYSPANAAIYRTLLAMNDRLMAIDPVTLREELSKSGELELVGGPAGLMTISGSVPNSANIEHYAEIVREKAVLRRLVDAGNRILVESYDSSRPADEVLDWAEGQILEIGDNQVSGDTRPLHEVLKDTMENIQKLAERSGESYVTGYETGYFQLDHYTGGLHGGELVIIAARPSMGKTTFALNMMRKMAVDYKHCVAIFSLEMSAENIARNLLVAQSRVRAQGMRNGHLTVEELEKLTLGLGTLREAKIFVDDTPGLSIGALRGACRRLKRTHDIKAVFIDYLQLMTGQTRSRDANRQEEISSISRGLKALARELDVPVLALSQLNRSVTERKDHRPMISDLRESGAIEQDADMVLLLHRPDYYEGGAVGEEGAGESAGKTEVIIAKQRNGPTGTVETVFIKEQLRFENISNRDQGGFPGE